MSKPKISVGALFAKGKGVALAETEAPPLPMPMPTLEVPDDQKTLIVDAADKPKKRPIEPPEPAPEPPPTRGRGRPPKPAKRDEIRSSFGLDQATYKQLKFYLLDRDITLQQFIESHVRSVLK